MLENVEYDKIDLEKDKPDISKSVINVDELPSMFKLYPNNVEIYYRTYVYDEVVFLSESVVPYYVKIMVLLDGIEVKNMDKLNLTYYDFLYINFLRKLSFLNSKEYYFEYFCNCSKEKIKHTFDLESIVDFKELEVDFPINLEFDGFSKKFNPLTVGSHLFLLKNNISSIRVKDTEIFLNNTKAELASMAEGDFKSNLKEISEYRFDHEQTTLLNLIEDYTYHGLNKYKFKCKNLVKLTEEELKLEEYKNEKFKKCGIEHNVEFLGGELPIFPFHRDRGFTRNRIIFGKKRNS